MSEEKPDVSIVPIDKGSSSTDLAEVNLRIQAFEHALLARLSLLQLPTDNVFVAVGQRAVVFKNLEDIIAQMPVNQRAKSLYISKFSAAVGAGLFDAALNYLWDETIAQLRERVAVYDLPYFFDNAVTNSERRKKLNTVEDLNKLEDSELIRGAKNIGLISEVGYAHLDYVRSMRNFASAAHPNQNQLTGLQLANWLETCIKEVISLPLSQIVVQIQRILTNIKAHTLTQEEARKTASFFSELTPEKVQTLILGFFGIYVNSDTDEFARQNVKHLLPYLWPRVATETRNALGIKYGTFVANSAQVQSGFAREFLESVGGLEYLPEDVRAGEIEAAVDALICAHEGFNNFYHEPPLATSLKRLIGQGRIPSKVREHYVLGLVKVFLTNGNGEAWAADAVYEGLLNDLTTELATRAVLSYNDLDVVNKLRRSQLCRERFVKLLTLLREKLLPGGKDLVDEMLKHEGDLANLITYPRIQAAAEALRKTQRK